MKRYRDEETKRPPNLKAMRRRRAAAHVGQVRPLENADAAHRALEGKPVRIEEGKREKTDRTLRRQAGSAQRHRMASLALKR